MGFFGKLIKATVQTALVPVDVVKDVVTMGGVLTDKEEPYTLKRLKDTEKTLEEAAEDASNGDL